MFTMVNTLNLKQIQVPQEEIQTERRNSEMEIHCVKPQEFYTTKIRSQLVQASKDQLISQYLQKYDYYTPTKLTTSNKLEPYSKYQRNDSPANSTSQKEGRLLSSASPTGSQISKKLHPTGHKQTYNGVEDDPQFPHHTSTCNTN